MRSQFTILVLMLGIAACDDSVPSQQTTEMPTEQGPAMPSSSSTGKGTTTNTSAGSAAPPKTTAGSSAPSGNSKSGTAGTSASAATAGSGASTAGSSSSPVSGGGGSTATTTTTSSGAAGSGGMAGGTAAAGGAPEAGGGATPTAALSDMQTLIPDASWDCGMPGGIPGPATGEMVFEIDFTVGEVHDIGETQYGHRLQIDVSGGKASGPKLDATLMTRGLDYQLTMANGGVELEQIHILQVGGSPVLMRNCGLAPSDTGQVRVVLDFEAPNSGSLSWLNEAKLIGTREFDAASKKLTMKVYSVSAAPDMANAVKMPAAPSGPHNTWACKKAAGTKGAVVYTESVGIGGSVSVGDSKRGTRNIIPITGGSTTGRVPGTVLSGGADFQIIEGGTFKEIDARYSVKANEGDIVIVRNCGPLGGLVPVFETAKDGKYAWLNANTWLSSDPGLGIGAVNLTIYEGGK